MRTDYDCLVYAAFDWFDEILYIGMTSDLLARAKVHTFTQPWAHAVAEWRVAGYFSGPNARTDAAALETQLIREEQPLMNGTSRRPLTDEEKKERDFIIKGPDGCLWCGEGSSRPKGDGFCSDGCRAERVEALRVRRARSEQRDQERAKRIADAA